MASTVAGVLLTGNHASRPSSGVTAGTLYSCTTHSKIYQTSDTGSTWADWATLGTSSTTVATDTIWDAAGDLAVGSGADTAARLAKGAAGGALSIINSAVAWNSGTSNPGSAATGDRYWRTDARQEVFYDGTRWLTTTLYHDVLAGPFDGDATAAANGWPNAVNAKVLSRTALWSSDFQPYIETLYGQSFVGTTNDGSNYWTVALSGAITGTAYGNFTTAADTVNTQTRKKATLNVLAGATEGGLILTATKTGSPGSIYVPCSVTYRLVIS